MQGFNYLRHEDRFLLKVQFYTSQCENLNEKKLDSITKEFFIEPLKRI